MTDPFSPELNRNPWQIKSSQHIYENPWISLTEHKVLTPGGSDGIYGVVHFQNMAIGVIPIDNEGYTYLVGQYRFPLNSWSWEIPEGGGPHNISALESAQRELKEETGFTANKWTELGEYHLSNSVSDEVGYLFLAEDLVAGESQPEDTEDLRIWRLPLAEAVQLALDCKITDTLSVIGLLKVARIRGL